jgi:hypothetical protein
VKWLARVPIIKTLQISTRRARESARAELLWNIGLSFIPVFTVTLIIIFSKPLGDAPRLIFSTLGRGELMVYASSICGVVLYTLRHNINGPIPESIASRTTSIGTLTTLTVICTLFAISAYLIRRMSDIHNLSLNEGLITWASLIILILSVIIAFVVFALKHSLVNGAADAAREGDTSFAEKWEKSKNA